MHVLKAKDVQCVGNGRMFNTHMEVFLNADGKIVPVICDPDKMLEEAFKAPFNYANPFLNIPQEVLARILPFCHRPTETWKTLQGVCKELYVRINDSLSPVWLKWAKVKDIPGVDWSIAWVSARAFRFCFSPWHTNDREKKLVMPMHPCSPLHRYDMNQITVANGDAKLKKMTLFIRKHRRYLRNIRLCALNANQSDFESVAAEIFNDQSRVSHLYTDLPEMDSELATRTIQLALNCQYLKSLRLIGYPHASFMPLIVLPSLFNAKATLSHLWFEHTNDREGGMEELHNIAQTIPSLIGIIVTYWQPESKDLYYKIRAQAKKNKVALELKK